MGRKGVSARSIGYRATRRVYLKGKVRAVGLDKHNLTVYHFQGLGYWICPPFVSLCETEVGNLLIRAGSILSGKRVKTVSPFTPDKIKEAMAYVLSNLAKHGVLFSHPTTARDLSTKSVEICEASTNNSSSGYSVVVGIRQGVTDVYGTKKIKRYCVSYATARKNAEELTALKIEMIELFRKRYSITVEEALVFHKENPAVTIAE